MYHLPRNYRRQIPAEFDDHDERNGWVWQPDVYPAAAELARTAGASTIVDVGCGAARKLAPYAGEFDLVGVDRPEIVDRIDLPGMWLAHDLDAAGELPVDCADAVVVCSDVIEHMVHPEHLGHALVAVQRDAAAVLISTPDRLRARGRTHRGPSPNVHHAQEWALDELTSWLGVLGLDIVYAGYTRSNDHEPGHNTCLIRC